MTESTSVALLFEQCTGPETGGRLTLEALKKQREKIKTLHPDILKVFEMAKKKPTKELLDKALARVDNDILEVSLLCGIA